MFTAKVSYKIKEKINHEEIDDLSNSLLGALRMNGQILGEQFLIAHTNNKIDIYVNTPDRDSLSQKYNNKYVNKILSKLIEDKVENLRVTVLGEEINSAYLCDCEKQSGFILFTTYISLESPLRCFDCFGVVPLYKIPKTYDEEYYDIISWKSNYQSCDSLQMNCIVGENFALSQLSKINSQLTKQGLKICKSIEKVTNQKTYYYLLKSQGISHKSELKRKCPKCNEKWLLEKPFHDLFDFKCDKCKLLSNIAWDLR